MFSGFYLFILLFIFLFYFILFSFAPFIRITLSYTLGSSIWKCHEFLSGIFSGISHKVGFRCTCSFYGVKPTLLEMRFTGVTQ